MMRILVLAVVAVLALWAALFFTDSGVLIGESIKTPRENYIVPSRGTPRDDRQGKLICRYFDGRAVKTLDFWHAASGIGGLKSCPGLVTIRR